MCIRDRNEYERHDQIGGVHAGNAAAQDDDEDDAQGESADLSLIHISEPTRPY